MYELKKNGKVFTSKSVGTGLLSYEKKNLQGRVLTKVEKHCLRMWFSQLSSYSTLYICQKPLLRVTLCYFVWIGLCVIRVRILYVVNTITGKLCFTCEQCQAVHPSLATLQMWSVLQILSVRCKFVKWNQWQCNFKCTDHALAGVNLQTICAQSKRLVL